jgi:hypothetical protein
MISCGPHYHLESLSVFIEAFYIPPQTDAGTKTALNELKSAISKQENAHPEAVLLVARDMNAGKINQLTNFYQHFKCATREKKT